MLSHESNSELLNLKIKACKKYVLFLFSWSHNSLLADTHFALRQPIILLKV